MEKIWEMQKKSSKLVAISIVFDAKFCKNFFIFLKFIFFWTKSNIYFWNLVGKSFRNSHLKKKTFKIVLFAVFFKRSVYVPTILQTSGKKVLEPNWLKYLLKVKYIILVYLKSARFLIFETLCFSRSKTLIYVWKWYHKNEQHLCFETHSFS